MLLPKAVQIGAATQGFLDAAPTPRILRPRGIPFPAPTVDVDAVAKQLLAVPVARPCPRTKGKL